MADKPKKPQKLRARLPRGLADRSAGEIAATRRMLETIREVFERYGFEPVETPAMEYTDVLGKFLPDQDRPNEGVFSFQDDDEQWISLRYDLTAPLARYVAENFDSLPKPYRSYRAGYVYRNEKPGPGRFRQFMQFDADTVGSASPAADAEMCMMAADTMEALGIPRGSYVVKVNNRKVLDELKNELSTVEPISDAQWLTAVRAIDKIDRVGVIGVHELLGEGRRDESGDFTKGAKLSPVANAAVVAFTTHSPPMFLEFQYDPRVLVLKDQFDAGGRRVFRSARIIHSLSRILKRDLSETNFAKELRSMDDMEGLMRSAGYGSDRIRFDVSVVRGLEYYTGPVYEVELLLETKDEKGRPVRFGSVGGGGRYDGLVSRFRGEPVPATGFSIGVSRLQAALDLINRDKPQLVAFGPVVVTVFDKDRVADYQKMVATLRNADIRAELYLGNPKNMGNQLKYADKRNSPCVIIQGSDEKARNEVQIKDLIEGAKAAAAIASNAEWRETRPAQFAVPEDKLVEAVREVLARHEVKWGN
jgi:histidyl-tRNA synthetase